VKGQPINAPAVAPLNKKTSQPGKTTDVSGGCRSFFRNACLA
jgi:hypothetical protein